MKPTFFIFLLAISFRGLTASAEHQNDAPSLHQAESLKRENSMTDDAPTNSLENHNYHVVTLAQFFPFFIDLTADLQESLWSNTPQMPSQINRIWDGSGYHYSLIPGQEDKPVLGISSQEQAHYCTWLSNRDLNYDYTPFPSTVGIGEEGEFWIASCLKESASTSTRVTKDSSPSSHENSSSQSQQTSKTVKSCSPWFFFGGSWGAQATEGGEAAATRSSFVEIPLDSSLTVSGAESSAGAAGVLEVLIGLLAPEAKAAEVGEEIAVETGCSATARRWFGNMCTRTRQFFCGKGDAVLEPSQSVDSLASPLIDDTKLEDVDGQTSSFRGEGVDFKDSSRVGVSYSLIEDSHDQ